MCLRGRPPREIHPTLHPHIQLISCFLLRLFASTENERLACGIARIKIKPRFLLRMGTAVSTKSEAERLHIRRSPRRSSGKPHRLGPDGMLAGRSNGEKMNGGGLPCREANGERGCFKADGRGQEQRDSLPRVGPRQQKRLVLATASVFWLLCTAGAALPPTFTCPKDKVGLPDQASTRQTMPQSPPQQHQQQHEGNTLECRLGKNERPGTSYKSSTLRIRER